MKYWVPSKMKVKFTKTTLMSPQKIASDPSVEVLCPSPVWNIERPLKSVYVDVKHLYQNYNKLV